MIQSHVCFRKLFLEVLWRMPRRRQAGGQGNPLTGYLLPYSGKERLQEINYGDESFDSGCDRFLESQDLMMNQT